MGGKWGFADGLAVAAETRGFLAFQLWVHVVAGRDHGRKAPGLMSGLASEIFPTTGIMLHVQLEPAFPASSSYGTGCSV